MDELDPHIQEWFKAADEELPQADFTRRIGARLRRERMRARLERIAVTMLHGIASGVTAPLRAPLRYRRLMAASLALMTLWVAMQGT